MKRTPRARGLRMATTAALVCALTASLQQPAVAEPATLPAVRAQLEELYHDAEVATEKYNAAGEKVTRQAERVRLLQTRVGVTKRKLARLASQAGAAARSQYRGGGLPAEVQFVLTHDPEHALDNASLTARVHSGTRRLMTTLADAHDELRGLSDDASDELERLRGNRRAMASHRKTVQRRIDTARSLESRLAVEQRRQLDELEQQDAADAQAQWVSTGILDHLGTETGAAGRKALDYATRQLGEPYVWGAEGPDSFDCSGLTSQAWLAAGVTIPRTSQEQWRLLQRVPLESMRPGDLIIYHADASHVALYIGAGDMIHAPRPGRTVTVAPAGSMEILGVVRPDA
ncbi:C40 family peptidase [Streptomyces sp. CHD11]|uniref:C40 family peptidase n=1 Tax=Streptomyces sp. CHD11 TaxID=2741325 RepID=UPI001BFC3233|nr:C40 family peptidase [Streptomyces sp. CHD11]MBT3154936.1 C40 family peptidase [Streptomyces sp. CHD11]